MSNILKHTSVRVPGSPLVTVLYHQESARRDLTTSAAVGAVTDLQATSDGLRLCSVSDDKTLKIYDVSSFDMVNMMSLPCAPSCCTWIETKPSTHAKV